MLKLKCNVKASGVLIALIGRCLIFGFFLFILPFLFSLHNHLEEMYGYVKYDIKQLNEIPVLLF